jgi:RNA 2',3'-cyclic 3'-phosphodiesterase
MHRLFVAIRPPEAIRDLLIDGMDDSPDFRWQDEEQLHLTLRFVGEVDRPIANDLADALHRVKAAPFDARISGAGRFEQRSSGALWAGVEPKAPLAALAAKVERACQSVGLEPERKRGFASGPFPIDRFILFESRLSRHGAHYEEVASYPLV